MEYQNQNENKKLFNYIKNNYNTRSINEEDKNNYYESRNDKRNNLSLSPNTNYRNLLYSTPRNIGIYYNYPNQFNTLKNNSLNNKTIFQNLRNLNKIINQRNRNNLRNIERSSSVCNMLNSNEKKIKFFNGLNKNRSTEELLNKKTIYFFPAIKPRRIIIDYYCGPNELHITNINKKNSSYKKYGRNAFFMGSKFNPENYEIKQANRFNRNYYGKVFSN